MSKITIVGPIEEVAGVLTTLGPDAQVTVVVDRASLPLARPASSVPAACPVSVSAPGPAQPTIIHSGEKAAGQIERLASGGFTRRQAPASLFLAHPLAARRMLVKWAAANDMLLESVEVRLFASFKHTLRLKRPASATRPEVVLLSVTSDEWPEPRLAGPDAAMAMWYILRGWEVFEDPTAALPTAADLAEMPDPALQLLNECDAAGRTTPGMYMWATNDDSGPLLFALGPDGPMSRPWYHKHNAIRDAAFKLLHRDPK